jgi:hypothetical protein
LKKNNLIFERALFKKVRVAINGFFGIFNVAPIDVVAGK